MLGAVLGAVLGAAPSRAASPLAVCLLVPAAPATGFAFSAKLGLFAGFASAAAVGAVATAAGASAADTAGTALAEPSKIERASTWMATGGWIVTCMP